MDAKVEKIEKGEAFLEIEVSPEKFEEGMEKAYRKVVKEISIPGFRKGKVPRQLLESQYGPEVLYQDALEYIIPPAFEEAVSNTNIELMGQPEFDFDMDKYEKGTPFIFKAVVAVKPEVALGDLEGLEVEDIQNTEITEEMVDHELEMLQGKYSQMIEKTDGTAENGDIVTMDFEGFIDGVPFEGGQADNYDITLGSNTFIPGFEEQMAGMKAGDEKDIFVTFPDEYQEELAGKPAVFKVKVHRVQNKVLRELNDEFAQEVSSFETMEELRADIRSRLENRAEKQRKDILSKRVLDKATAVCEIPLADSAIEAQAWKMVQDMEERMKSQGFSMEQYLQMTGSTAEQTMESLKGDAEVILRNNLMLEKIVQEKGIEITDEEIDKYIADMMEGYPDEKAMKEYMNYLRENIRKEMAVNKAIDLLLDKAQLVAPEKGAEEETGAVTETEE